MRIIAGQYKGKNLKYPKNHSFRPTQSKVKEALFNIIQDRVGDSVFLDLFCGTGAIGLEALSRGARKVVFSDENTQLLKQNLQGIPPECYQVVAGDIKKFFKFNQEKFNIIFLDPPWKEASLYEYTLKAIFEFDILETGLIICEHYKKIEVKNSFPAGKVRTYKYGSTYLTVYDHTTQ
jgi:16S rRNA (guanine966-N2)-methyltransferase